MRDVIAKQWLAISFCLICILVVTSAQAAPSDLALKRVMLSTGGVGYFEYEAKVSGDAMLSLPVRADQVDDVMKSIVVYDNKGTVGSVSLPGKETLQDVFRKLPFDRGSMESPQALLNSLRGAEITVKDGDVFTGKILAVVEENAQLPNDGGTITQHNVTVMTRTGLRHFILEKAASVEFTDTKLRDQLHYALGAMSRYNLKESRQLSISIKGSGERMVRVAYVAATPLWKATYRLVTSKENDKQRGLFQGWAIVENNSGDDWENVDLTIVAGNPVTFYQRLYDIYYVKRPEVPVEVLGRILPRVDQGLISEAKEESMPAEDFEAPAGGIVSSKLMRQETADVMASRGMGMAVMEAPAAAAPAPMPVNAMLAAAQASEAEAQFSFRMLNPVNVASGDSVLVPILNKEVPIETVSLYQPDVQRLHPLFSVRLKNDTESSLPPGTMALFERDSKGTAVTYLGDAQLSTMPIGEERLLSFAVDQKIKISREDKSEEMVTDGKIADGVFVIKTVRRQESKYLLKGDAKEPRKLIIEHEKLSGWDIVEPPADKVQVADRFYRIRKQLKAGEESALIVATEYPVSQRLLLTDMASGQLSYYASASRLSEKMRRVLSGLSELSAKVENLQREADLLQSKISQIEEGQKRLRENLTSVPKDSKLADRYMQKMSEQESSIETLEKQLDAKRAEVEKAKAARQEYVRKIEV